MPRATQEYAGTPYYGYAIDFRHAYAMLSPRVSSSMHAAMMPPAAPASAPAARFAMLLMLCQRAMLPMPRLLISLLMLCCCHVVIDVIMPRWFMTRYVVAGVMSGRRACDIC